MATARPWAFRDMVSRKNDTHWRCGHFISQIFMGLATRATKSLLPLILSDVTFLHERSFYFGLYWSIQDCVNAGFLIAMSYLVAAMTWRWYYWLFAITLGISALLVVFCCPETKFARSPTSLNGEVVFTDEFGHTQIITSEEAIARFGQIEDSTQTHGKKKTFFENLKPWSPTTPNGGRVLAASYVKILKSTGSPGVIFALMLSSISLGVTLVYSTILETQYH